MSPLRAVVGGVVRGFLVAVAVVVVLGGAAFVALTAGDEPDRRRTVAGHSSNPHVAAARPVAPRRVGRRPQSTEIMRVRPPGGGTELAVTVKRVIRDRGPKAFRRVRCLDAVSTRRVRTHRFRASVACVPLRGVPPGPGLAMSITGGLGQDGARMGGFAPRGTRRMTIAGAGPTVDVPLGRHGAWFAIVDDTARRTLTLTAELADGSTRFERLRFPSGIVPADTPEVDDPTDGSTWSVLASRRSGGGREGQTCVQFFRLDARGMESGFGPPMCGDLRREPLFVDALERGPGPQTKFGGDPHVERRMVVWGAASERVRELRVLAAGETHDVEIADHRGFILVLPPEVEREDVTVEAVLSDGAERTWRAPERAGAARFHRPGIRITRELTATIDRRRDRVLLAIGIAGRPDKVKVNFQSHPTYLRRARGDLYRGAVRYRRGLPGHLRPGKRFGAQVVICAPGCRDVGGPAGGVLR